jgi:hypothetical protein
MSPAIEHASPMRGRGSGVQVHGVIVVIAVHERVARTLHALPRSRLVRRPWAGRENAGIPRRATAARWTAGTRGTTGVG